MANLGDEAFAQTGAPPRGGVKTSSLGARKGKGKRHGFFVRFEVVLAISRQARQPLAGHAHVADLFFVYPFADAGAVFVSSFSKGVAVQQREVEVALLEELDPEELERLFNERMEEQKEKHQGGNKWIGTEGTSPFGHSGRAARQGIRVGGKGKGRSAIKTADARLYAGYREDLTLDVRQMQLALRKLRTFTRVGGDEELDLEGTIAATAKNAGELEVVTQPPRRPNTRVILMMDVGGSMDPFAHLCSRLFSATKKSSHFKELRTYYFHNCVYGRVYETERFTDPIRVNDLLHECGPHYKLIMVGDALMAPYELMSPGGSIHWEEDGERAEGIVWLMRLQKHFRRSVWLNPEPQKYWLGNTIENIASVFDMYPLTLDGLGEATTHLMKSK